MANWSPISEVACPSNNKRKSRWRRTFAMGLTDLGDFAAMVITDLHSQNILAGLHLNLLHDSANPAGLSSIER
jgi:hypothetical protein